jgi:hypothetical protein
VSCWYRPQKTKYNYNHIVLGLAKSYGVWRPWVFIRQKWGLKLIQANYIQHWHTSFFCIKLTWTPSLLCPYSLNHHKRMTKSDIKKIFQFRLNSRDYLREKLQRNTTISTTASLRRQGKPTFAVLPQHNLTSVSTKKPSSLFFQGCFAEIYIIIFAHKRWPRDHRLLQAPEGRGRRLTSYQQLIIIIRIQSPIPTMEAFMAWIPLSKYPRM